MNREQYKKHRKEMAEKKYLGIAHVIMDKYKNEIVTFELIKTWMGIKPGQPTGINPMRVKAQLNKQLKKFNYKLVPVQGQGYKLVDIKTNTPREECLYFRGKVGNYVYCNATGKQEKDKRCGIHCKQFNSLKKVKK